MVYNTFMQSIELTFISETGRQCRMSFDLESYTPEEVHAEEASLVRQGCRILSVRFN